MRVAVPAFLFALLTPSLAFACNLQQVATYPGDYMLVGAFLAAALCLKYSDLVIQGHRGAAVTGVCLAAGYLCGVFVARETVLAETTYFGLVALACAATTVLAIGWESRRTAALWTIVAVLAVHVVWLGTDHNTKKHVHHWNDQHQTSSDFVF